MKKKKNKVKEYLPLYLMMLPGLLYLLINNYLPMTGIILAFKKLNFSKGILASPWAGLDNFKFLFSSKDAWIITRNTLLYNIAFILVNMVVGIAIAILICEVKNTKMKKIYQSAILLPFLIYIASLIGIDPTYYEAARLDGATKWQEITKITLPCLVPTIITLLLLSIGRIFYSDFGLFYQVPMNSGVLFPTTNVIDTYVYRALIEQGNISMSSAAGVYQSLVGFVIVMLSNWIVRRVDKDRALF